LISASFKWIKLEIKGDAPAPRYFHSSTVLGSKIVIFGGRSSIWWNDVWILDTDELSWTNLKATTESLPAPRCGHSATALPEDGKIIIYGGRGEAHKSKERTKNYVEKMLDSAGRNLSFTGKDKNEDQMKGELLFFLIFCMDLIFLRH